MLHIPIGAALVEHKIGPNAEHIVLSLRTADRSEIITRNAAVLAYLENVFVALRCTKPSALSHREGVGLSGEWYRGWASEETARVFAKVEPESPEFNEQLWEAVLPKEQARIDSGEAQREIAPYVDAFLVGKGLCIDANSTEMLLRECAKARLEGLESQLRNTKGDYSPDPKAARFPPSPDPSQKDDASGKSLTLDALFKKWRDHPENKRAVSQATVRAYDRAFRALGAFVAEKRSVLPTAVLAASVSRAEIQQFADKRLSEGTSVATVNDGDLAALKSIFGWAVSRDLMTRNAADGIRFKEDKKGKRPTEKTGFTEEEATAILKHALSHKRSGRESDKMAAAKRWVPWLQAYSGTRVGEMGQLRKQDIKLHNKRWAMEVTPDAGKQKRGNAWLIPLHPHLIELGFVDFVRAAPAGHLFITPNPKAYKVDAPDTRSKDPRGILGPLSAVNNRLAEFAREVVKRPDVAPKRGNAILDSGATKFSKTPLEALDAGRVGLNPDSISGKLFNAGAGLLDGVSTRALEAADEFFKQTIYSSEVMSRAFTDGVNLRLSGDELKAYVLAQRDAAFQELPEIGSRVANIEGNAHATAALDVARFNTFTQDVPSQGIAASVLTTTNKWPLLKFAVPFVRVVNNILDYSAALTPGLQRLSRLYKDQVARGGREAAIAQGRLAMGSAMWTAAVSLAAGGYITGPGPDDYKKRQELEQTGWRAHSLRIGDTYIDLNRLDPIGFPFNLAGEFYQRWQEAERDDESAVQVASAMALAFYHNIADRSFLKGFTDLFDAIGDRDGSQLARFAANIGGSLLVPNFVRQTATNRADRYLHEARGFIENVMRRVPGLSDNLAVRRMPWGEKMQLNPSLYTVKKADPLMLEYARLLETGERGSPDPLSRMKSIPGDKSMDLAREMLPDGQNLYDAYGDLIMQPAPDAPPLRDVLKQLINSPDYGKLIDGPGDLRGTKLSAWRRIVGRYRAAAWRAVLQKYPSVREKVYAKKRDAMSRSLALRQSITVENYFGQ